MLLSKRERHVSDGVTRARSTMAAERLADLLRGRLRRPETMLALRALGPFTDRERTLLKVVLETTAVELEHALEHDRQSDVMRLTRS